jgi:hypothetical protein
MNLPYSYKVYLGRSGTGAKQFSDTVTGLCYATGEVKIIKDNDGKEAVSTKQLYVDGTVPIVALDNVLFEDSESEIQSIGFFYRNGIVDIKVVYL